MTATRCKMDTRLIALFSNCISKNKQRINKKNPTTNDSLSGKSMQTATTVEERLTEEEEKKAKKTLCSFKAVRRRSWHCQHAVTLLLKIVFLAPKDSWATFTSTSTFIHIPILLFYSHPLITHSLTHSASGRFELRAASNSTLQYALGKMEKWATGLKGESSSILAWLPACLPAGMAFIFHPQSGTWPNAFCSFSLPRPMPQFKYLCKRAILWEIFCNCCTSILLLLLLK